MVGSEDGVLDRSTVDQLLELDRSGPPGFFLEVLSEFEKQAEGLVPELSAAARAEDLHQVMLLAHKLKGSARTVGATAVASLCESLERDSAAGAAPGALAQVKAISEALEVAQAALRACQSP